MRSMTAFARQQGQGEWGTLSVELRSVNHRYLDIFTRLPEEFRNLEPRVRERLGERLSRGKVECSLRFEAASGVGGELVVDKDLANKIAHASREVDSLIYNPAPVSSLDILKWPGVLRAPAPDLERLHAEAMALLDAALDEMVATRAREGEQLGAAIAQRTEAMADIVGRVRERMPRVLEHLRGRLTERLAELKGELDSDRVEQEMVLLAQKLDVDEEMDRLAAHVEEIGRVTGRDEPVGRRLDFLMQECNREANTLASKSVDTEVTRAAVDLKVLIEQIREQVQNIE